MWSYLWFTETKYIYFFSLTEHVVTFTVWQMVLVVKQPIHVHTFIYNRFHGTFSTELSNWWSHYLVSSYLNVLFLLCWRHNDFSAHTLSSIVSFVPTPAYTIWRWRLYMDRMYFTSHSLIFMTSKQKNEINMNCFCT